MKSVLISIQPKWCEMIANGRKTIEVRKTIPKIETSFKCYIYCTKKFYIKGNGYFQGKYCGKVMGEFVCDRISDMRDVEKEPTCLTTQEWRRYTDNHKGTVWGWHISDLVIYDKPKELGEFYTECKSEIDYKGDWFNYKPLTRPPQSWCYIEEVNENDRA